MKPILRLLLQLSWLLGLLSIVAAVLVKLLAAEQRFHVTGHTMFLVASTFFLCSLATWGMMRGGD